VADVRLGLEVMSQRDPRDPWWVPAPLEGPKPPAPIRVALAKLPADMRPDPAVMALVRQAADHLADAGYAVEEVEVPDLDGTWQLWADLLLTELVVLQKAQMWEVGSDRFKTALEGFIGLGTALDQEGYMKGIAQRSRVIRNWLAFLETYPVLLTPLSIAPVPGKDADLGGPAQVRKLFHHDLRFMGAMNLLGLPAAVVPVGLAGGAPAGVQLVASRYREDLCLDAAAAIEARTGTLLGQLWQRG
jgi:amidase